VALRTEAWLDPLAEWVTHLRGDSLPSSVRTRVAFCALDWWGALAAERIRAAIIAGYEAGLRVGTLLGKARYSICHMTAAAGCFGACVCVGATGREDRKDIRPAQRCEGNNR